MVREEQISTVAFSFTVTKLGQADCIMKACTDANFGSGVSFNLAEKEDFTFEGKWF